MHHVLRAALLGGLLLVAGCSDAKSTAVVTPDGTATQGRLTTIAWLYGLHVELKQRSPANYEELRAFAETLPPAHGGPSGLAEPFLVSPHDKKPLVIRYGLKPPLEGQVVAHERDGVNGRRFVVLGGSNRVEQVDDAGFREICGPTK